MAVTGERFELVTVGAAMATAAAAVTVLLVVLPGVAAAQEPTGQEQRIDELGLSVSVGYDGRATGSSWQPVTVALEPARPLAGTLSVTSTGNWGPAVETLPVEVAAGSRKVYRFLVPSGSIRLGLEEDGQEPLAVRPPGRGNSAEYLVGLLGTTESDLPPLRSEFIGQSGAWVFVDPAWAEQSPLALEPLGTLVADVAALQALSPRARANLAAGVARGTDLVVVGEQVDLRELGLPWDTPDDAWQLTAPDLTGRGVRTRGAIATASPAGYGRVFTTAVRPGEAGLGRSGELWSMLTQPNPRHGEDQTEYRIAQVPHQFGRLLAEQGRSAPALPWLGAFVAVYVLVVGPVNGVVLSRMGRRELAWATVPMVTVIFTAGAFMGATTGRPPTGASARLLFWNGGAAGEFVAAGIRAATPGTRSLTLEGADWTVRPLLDTSRQAAVSQGTDTSVTMDLTALQLGAVAAWRAVEQRAPFTVTAVAGPQGVDVTVRNDSGRRLEDVVVRLASTSRSMPDLNPGEDQTVTVGGNRLPQDQAYRDPFEGLALDANGIAGPPQSLRAVLNSEFADGRPGMVWVSAVDPQADGARVTSGNERVTDHGAVLAVGSAVEQGQGLSPHTIQRVGFSTANGGYRPGPQAIEGVGEAFLRFRLPPGANLGLLRNQLDVSNQSGGPGRAELTVWDRADRQWVPAAAGLSDPRRVVSPLGEIWVRASGELFPFEYSARTVAGDRT